MKDTHRVLVRDRNFEVIMTCYCTKDGMMYDARKPKLRFPCELFRAYLIGFQNAYSFETFPIYEYEENN